MNCKNCGNSINENFCSNCGQRTTVDTINYKTISGYFQNDIFQINRGFLFTIKELTLRPGHAIRCFIKGKRKVYYKPISFLLISVTLYIFVSYLLKVDSFIAEFLNSTLEGWNSARYENETDLPANDGLIGWLKTNQTYLVFFIVPIYALSSYIVFIKNKFNYYEHLVLQLYITGQQFLMTTVLTCAFFFNKELLGSSVVIVSMCYTFLVYLQFFEDKKFINIFFRYLLILVVWYAMFFIIIMIGIFLLLKIKKIILSQ